MHRIGAIAGFLALVVGASAQPVPVTADPGVAPLPIASLEALAPTQLWQALDGAEYWAVPRQAPAGYYAAADTSSASALRQWLHTRIAGHRVFPYTHTSRPGQAGHTVDVWDIVVIADRHPERSDRVLDLYLNGTFDPQEAGTNSNPHYDREHSWPKSLGFPDEDAQNAAYSDCHHLFAAYQSYNSSRSNKPYGEEPVEAEFRRSTLENVGRGGGLMDEPESSNYSFRDVWQVWLGRRGDAARAMFYMDVRYDGATNEPDLVLTGDITRVEQRNVWESGGQAFMGLLPVLVKWHREDPVDDMERRRNGVVYLFQQNRNPFVDHPEWVGPIFAGEPMPGPGTPLVQPGGGAAAAWINEFHYDNDSADADEFVEVCGPAGTDLTGWSIVGYNGNGGHQYKTVSLSGVIPDQLSGFGAVAVGFADLQNGSPDGIALVDAAGRAIELIGYEGRFTAADGPAAGMVSVDVGTPEEGNSTPAGCSIQRRGHGRVGADFGWLNPTPASRGRVNDGQTFN